MKIAQIVKAYGIVWVTQTGTEKIGYVTVEWIEVPDA